MLRPFGKVVLLTTQNAKMNCPPNRLSLKTRPRKQISTRARSVLSLTSLFATAFILCGCVALGLEDNATNLAFAMERGARELRASAQSDYIIHYEPLGKLGEAYEVKLQHSREVVRTDAFGNTLNRGGGYLVVTGRYGGGTNYHERFVFTPRDLHITKTNAPTDIVLRKAGDRVDVVELR